MAKTKKTKLAVDKNPKEFFSDANIESLIEEAGGLPSPIAADFTSGKTKIIARKALLKWQLERIAKNLLLWQELKDCQSLSEISEPTIPHFDDYPPREKRADDAFDSFINQLCHVWQDTFQEKKIKTSYNLNKEIGKSEAGGPFVKFATACWNHLVQFGAEKKTRNAIRDAVKKRLKKQATSREWHEERTHYALQHGYGLIHNESE